MADGAQRQSRTQRLNLWVRSNPLVLVAGLLLFLLTTAVGLVGYGLGAYGWWNRTQNWRSDEYKKLGYLHSDFTLGKFVEALGAPLYQQRSRDHRWVEYTFQGRGSFWVQALTRAGSPSVGYFAVTSCSSSFRPTFELPPRTRVTLRVSTLGQLRKEAVGFSYTLPVSSVPSLFEYTLGSHATNFKSFAWGYNGACGEVEDVDNGNFAPFYSDTDFWSQGSPQGSILGLPRPIAMAGRKIIVNTFAEWGPTEGSVLRLTWPPRQIGVGEVQIRGVKNDCGIHC
jgi:hypothetical protein